MRIKTCYLWTAVLFTLAMSYLATRKLNTTVNSVAYLARERKTTYNEHTDVLRISRRGEMSPV